MVSGFLPQGADDGSDDEGAGQQRIGVTGSSANSQPSAAPAAASHCVRAGGPGLPVPTHREYRNRGARSF